MKRIVTLILSAMLLISPVCALETLTDDAITITAPAGILMEKTTGQIIYAKDAHQQYAPASVTKVMTMLLIVEEIEAGNLTLDTLITCSSRASSMGGSQVYLEEGEQMTVHDMLKAIAVSSANDAAVAMAEHISGTEEAFATKMNQRAAELGLENTNFTNCTGLFDDPEHYTTAYDIAQMSRVLISYDLIKDYTTIWMDSLRDGEFTLANTNKLIYYYEGATGLKTGFTNMAMYCLSATAERDGIEYIAVVMHDSNSTDRFESAKTLLNYAFANYSLVSLRYDTALPPVLVSLGSASSVQPVYAGDEALLLEKSSVSGVSYSLNLEESVPAPVLKGQQLGTLTLTLDGETLAEVPIVACEGVERLSHWQIFVNMLKLFCSDK